ncbi:MAG: NUDIX domain-containing protein [Candidatus Pacebacteria bacterium]|nr:NUDIX domain-containing protein [Candidatus Paceibacterota bacterium]
MTSMDIDTKKVILVDEQDQIIGSDNLYSAHRHPAQRHRAISVWLVRGEGQDREIFLQKRSLEKIVGADLWGNGVCGNVKPDESYIGCANRRLSEEIGVENISLNELYKFEYKVYSNEKYGEHEIDQVYLAYYDGQFEPNPAEVAQVQWVKLGELERRLANLSYISAKETLVFATNQLAERTPPLELFLNDKNNMITPWTAMMLFDKRLRSALRDF